MRLSENEIERFGMTLDDLTHRLDPVLETFAATDQAEG